MPTHIVTGSTAPASAPAFIGQHYVDTANGNHYLAVGTSSASDWALVGDSSLVAAQSGTDVTFGGLTLAAGTGITLTESNADTITIDSSGGGSGGGGFTAQAFLGSDFVNNGGTYELEIQLEQGKNHITVEESFNSGDHVVYLVLPEDPTGVSAAASMCEIYMSWARQFTGNNMKFQFRETAGGTVNDPNDEYSAGATTSAWTVGSEINTNHTSFIEDTFYFTISYGPSNTDMAYGFFAFHN